MLTYIILALLAIIAFFLGKLIGKLQSEKTFKQRLLEARKDSLNRSRAVIQGQISEQIAPLLKGFPYEASDLRFIGKPIDFIAFKGMNEKNIEEVIFVEVKTGDSKLSSQEKKLKKAIEDKKVSWYEYRI